MERIVFLLMPVGTVVLIVIAKMWFGILDNLAIMFVIALIVAAIITVFDRAEKSNKL